MAVAEACRNIVCSGGRPLAATNCLNFGNPEHPEVMWQLSEAIDGMAEAFLRGGLALSAAQSLTPQTPAALTADQVIES